MKAKITKHECFNIEINGVMHYNFAVKSKWNGIVEYKNQDGTVIASDEFEDEMFAFLMIKPKAEGELVIIKASPFFCS